MLAAPAHLRIGPVLQPDGDVVVEGVYICRLRSHAVGDGYFHIEHTFQQVAGGLHQSKEAGERKEAAWAAGRLAAQAAVLGDALACSGVQPRVQRRQGLDAGGCTV